MTEVRILLKLMRFQARSQHGSGVWHTLAGCQEEAIDAHRGAAVNCQMRHRKAWKWQGLARRLMRQGRAVPKHDQIRILWKVGRVLVLVDASFERPRTIAKPSHCQAMGNGFGSAGSLRKSEPPHAQPKPGLQGQAGTEQP
jgi:hypothetical protein